MFEVKEQFYLNGKPFQIISGSIHYFRTVPEYWQDRLEKLVNMGCNTVETYIPWNFHETEKGKFCFEGMHDVERFIQLAEKLGLYVILRPSPYICSEWEFGGLPAWLLRDPNMRLRCSYEPYLQAVKEYYEVLIPRLVPYQIDRGGSIILIQIENEYGYYGNDTTYLEFLRDTMRRLGITVPFVTSDGPWSGEGFRSGMVRGALPTGNFGSGADWQFARMRELMEESGECLCEKNEEQTALPLMCMEFWNGWFDAWGEEHHTTEPKKAAEELDKLLARGSVNFYMFEGGTNFGFMSGRNAGSRTGDVTSYDYDAPLTEDGQLTPKYELFQQVISKYAPIRSVELSIPISRREYGKLSCTGRVDLFHVLDKLCTPINVLNPTAMEELGQNYGYILYRTQIKEYEAVKELELEEAADRVQWFLNERLIHTAFAETMSDKAELTKTTPGGVLELLCENMGRENFGTNLEKQRKGISGGVRINGHRQFGFSVYPLPLDEAQLGRLDFQSGYEEGLPAFYRFTLDAEQPADTFLDTTGFGKGCAFVNGFLLGRFWEIGPQRRLYIPAPLLNRGENSIVLFETEGKAADSVFLAGEPGLF